MPPAAFKKKTHNGAGEQRDDDGKDAVYQSLICGQIIDQPGKSDLIHQKAARQLRAFCTVCNYGGFDGVVSRRRGSGKPPGCRKPS
jgi:hypothetical protein